jgi:hypothetical protein
MTLDECKALWDGLEYPNEAPKEIQQAMAASNLVAVFGGSDALIELRGEIDAEYGAFGGGRYDVNHGDGTIRCQRTK